MKDKINIPIFLVLLLSICFISGQAQVLHELVLTVDTTEPSSTANHSFTTGSKTTILENSSANRFSIVADVGDSLLWKGKSAGESDETVNVVGINYISGPRIFSSNTLTGKRVVKATIIRGGSEDYVYELLYTLGSDSEVYAVTASIKTRI
jgi:hypothetical protein